MFIQQLGIELINCFYSTAECRKCGRLEREIEILPPEVTEKRTDVHLSFPYKCECGQLECMELSGPALFVGYLLFRIAKHRLEMTQGATEISDRLDTIEMFDQWTRDYDRIANLPSQPGRFVLGNPITDAEVKQFMDQLENTDFAVGGESWTGFLRELGIEAEETDEGADD